jgi:type IV pilus assembly protein PilM
MELKFPDALVRGGEAVADLLVRAFPTPKFLLPPAAGIDISDASIKWIVLAPDRIGCRVERWGEEPLKEGTVVGGLVKDQAGFTAALSEVRKKLGGVTCAHAAFPEEAAYLFEMRVPEGTSHDQALRLIEFEFEGRVPITPESSVFDFDVIERADGTEEEIGVAVSPRELAETYVALFEGAGITLLSLEVEARSIARAVTAPDDPTVTLLVDFGHARTGFAVLKRGVPIFSSTVEVGADAIVRALVGEFSFTPEQALAFMNEQGLAPEGGMKARGADAVVGVASALSDEVTRHYHYWDTRRNERGERMTPVSRIVLVGGASNLKGLTDYIAGRVQAPAVLGDVWQRVLDLDHSTPPIDRPTSLRYATAIGLALRSFV